MSETLNTSPENVSSPRENISDDSSLSDLSDLAEGGSRREREGLPRGYRMRADRHYVEQLGLRTSGQPVRMLSLDDIDSTDSFPQVDLEPLIQSIRTHGVLHPLLVRRNVNRYSVITGRKRLAAAHCLRLPTVPCLVHDVDDAQAAALAQADNLIARAMAESEDKSDLVAAIRRAVAQHLATTHAALEMMAGDASMTRPVLDLVRAHAWRASRLVDAVALITHTPLQSTQDRLLPTIVEQVVDGFRAEGRLIGFTLRAQILDGAPPASLDQGEVLAGVSGAVLAVLPLTEQVEQPTVLIKVAATTTSATVDVVQTAVGVPAALARRFFDKASSDRPGGWSAVAGALAAKSLAERHGGHATFEMGSSPGGGVRIVLPKRC